MKRPRGRPRKQPQFLEGADLDTKVIVQVIDERIRKLYKIKELLKEV